MDTQYVIPAPISKKATNGSAERLQVSVNIHATVITAEQAKKAANVWLLMNAGNLLGAHSPELLLGETLLWRFDVAVSLPNLDVPGTGSINRVGHICVNAINGTVVTNDTLIEEFIANADALTAR